MIARITRALIVMQLFVAVAVGYAVDYWTEIDLAAATLLGIITVVATRMAIVGNNFRIAGRFWSTDGSASSLTPVQLAGMFFREWRASMLSSTWSMPFGSKAWEDTVSATDFPVLLIHGYACNSGYWYSMRKALQQAGVRHHAIDLEPVFGDIDDYLPAVDHQIDALIEKTGATRIIIIGHSMGGLVARAYLRRYGSRRIAKIITIGTPHNGTVLAKYSAGRNCRQMHHDARSGSSSEWLQRLEESHKKEEREIITSIYSRHDNIVAPQTSCHLRGGRNIIFEGIGHVELGCNPAIHACIIQEIKAIGIKQETADAIAPIATH